MFCRLLYAVDSTIYPYLSFAFVYCLLMFVFLIFFVFFFFQAEDGIRDLVRSRGLGDVYKRQEHGSDPVLVVTPADQTIADSKVFHTAMQSAIREADLGAIVVLLSLIHI